jgi:hypothetical protein
MMQSMKKQGKAYSTRDRDWQLKHEKELEEWFHEVYLNQRRAQLAAAALQVERAKRKAPKKKAPKKKAPKKVAQGAEEESACSFITRMLLSLVVPAALTGTRSFFQACCKPNSQKRASGQQRRNQRRRYQRAPRPKNWSSASQPRRRHVSRPPPASRAQPNVSSPAY